MGSGRTRMKIYITDVAESGSITANNDHYSDIPALVMYEDGTPLIIDVVANDVTYVTPFVRYPG